MTLKRYLPFLLIGVAVAALYAHTLHVPFYLDDHYAIAEHPLVKNLGAAFGKVFACRGLSLLTFALNYHFNGLNVVGYHLVNIVIHVGSGWMSLLLLRRIFPQRPWLQLFGALLFVAHPLQTQGVTYLAQRMASLSALLLLSAVYLFTRAREFLAAGGQIRDREHLCWYAAALLTGGLAILAKENAVVLPVALVLFTRSFHASEESRWRPLLTYSAPFAVFPLLAVMAYFVWPLMTSQSLNTLHDSALMSSMEGNTPLHYLATQCSVLWIYIRMFFLPYGQALDHGYPVARELLSLRSVAGGLGLVGVGVFGWWLRRRQPTIAFGIGWFFLTLAIESSVIPLDPLFEHRLYLPMFGLSACATALLAMIPRQAWRIGAGIAVILTLSILTWRRNALWNDPIAFTEDNLRVTPHNERVCFNLGEKYLEAGRLQEGEMLIRKSLEMNPRPYFGYQALKGLYLAQGRIDEAIAMLQYGIQRVDAEKRGFLYNEMALLFGKKGEFQTAITVLLQAIAADPNLEAPYYNMAQMALLAGNRDLALQSLNRALQINPHYKDARDLLNNIQGGVSGLPPGHPGQFR